MKKTVIPPHVDSRILLRVLEEGYGPGAWHGADLCAALAGISPDDAFRRPAPGRHSIAEIALHHAWQVRGAIAQLTATEPAPFPLDGADWFELSDGRQLTWRDILRTVDELQHQLGALVADIGGGTITSPLPEREQFDLVLGITCHAVYHAGQVQLVKVLNAVQGQR